MAQLRTHYQGEERELFRVLLNATSPAEANLALKLLSDNVPEKILVSACNAREVLRALPKTPFILEGAQLDPGGADGFTRSLGALRQAISDEVDLVLTTAGDLVLDVILACGDSLCFWTPEPGAEDFISVCALDTVVRVEGVLDAMVRVAALSDAAFSPKFYLSLDDWRLDHAADAFKSLGDLF